MGVWGIATFENDEALDFLNEIEGCNDLSLIEESLNLGNSYIDMTENFKAIVACEVIILLNNKLRPNVPESLITWVSKLDPVNPDYLSFLVVKSKAALVKIFSVDSELWAQWLESPHFRLWRNEIDTMTELLNSIDGN